MIVNQTFARQVRLERLFRHDPARIFVVPLDHAVTDGPITHGEPLDHLVGQLSGSGVDAVVLHKGNLAHVSPGWFTQLSVIVHLSASTAHAPDPDAKYLVAGVEECMRIGADAVSVHVNLGSDDERMQIADMAAVSEACDRWNLPLLAMIYPRGPRVGNPADPQLIAHAAILAADLGADLVKVPHPGSAEHMRAIADSCPIPVIVAGGSRQDPAQLVAELQEALDGGAAGAAVGRNIFQATAPDAMARKLAETIHRPSRPVETAIAGPVFDFHARLGAGPAVRERLLAEMDRHGIERAAVSGGGVMDPVKLAEQIVNGGHTDVEPDNDAVLADCERSGGRLVPFYFANPHRGPHDYRAKASSFRALEISPAVHGVPLTDERTIALVSVAAEHGHPVYVVCLGRPGHGVRDLVELAEKFPHVTFVLGHCGFIGIDFYAVDVVAPVENIVAETSGCYTSVARAAVDRLGAGRVLFGTEYPVQDPGVELAKLRALKLPEERLRQIAWGNAARLLGLEG